MMCRKDVDKMTLDEAIDHAEEQSCKLGCTECGKEHKQLAEWLKELREIRKSREYEGR